MKKGKLLEVLRIAVMCIILEKEGSMNPTELGSFLGCRKTLIVEYARAHENLFEVSNSSISSKRVSLKYNGKEKNSQDFVLELLNFAENICDIPPDQILTRKFIEWFNPEDKKEKRFFLL
jgi:hypothetical protein